MVFSCISTGIPKQHPARVCEEEPVVSVTLMLLVKQLCSLQMRLIINTICRDLLFFYENIFH